MEEETTPEQPVAQPTPELHPARPEQSRREPTEGSQSPQKDWLKISLFVFASLVFLIGAGLAGYWYASRQQTVMPPEVVPTPSPSIEGQTKEWQTYTSIDNKYSIKIPSVWFFYPGSERGGTGAVDLISSFETAGETLSIVPKNELQVSIVRLMRSSYNQDLSKHLREHLGATTEEQINVAGVVGLKGIVLSSGEIDSYIIIILTKGESLYQITARPMDSSKIDLFDLILQTFQFAEDETSGWKTYEHKKFPNLSLKGFILSYPESWELTINEDHDYREPEEYGMLFLKLKKDGAVISISQAAFGGEGCLYPGDEDKEGPYVRYGEFTELIFSDQEIWRRSISLTSPCDDICYGFCEKSGDIFQSITSIGNVDYNLPEANEQLLNEMDQIVQKIKIIEQSLVHIIAY